MAEIGYDVVDRAVEEIEDPARNIGPEELVAHCSIAQLNLLRTYALRGEVRLTGNAIQIRAGLLRFDCYDDIGIFTSHESHTQPVVQSYGEMQSRMSEAVDAMAQAFDGIRDGMAAAAPSLAELGRAFNGLGGAVTGRTNMPMPPQQMPKARNPVDTAARVREHLHVLLDGTDVEWEVSIRQDIVVIHHRAKNNLLIRELVKPDPTEAGLLFDADFKLKPKEAPKPTGKRQVKL
jgi:hypothetical protein